MLNLSNDDRKQLREALTSGFRSYPNLKRFVSDHFTFRLNEIAPSNALRDAADALVEHFEEGSRDGDLTDLILALYQARPRNPEVQKLMHRLQGFLQQRLLLDPIAAPEIGQPFDLTIGYDDIQLESFLPKPPSYETDVGKLRRGLQRADAVCRVAFSDRDTTGTGVLIAPDLILTNYHVLSKQPQERSRLAELAKTVLFEFGCVSEEADQPILPDSFTVVPTEAIVADSPPTQLDYVLLRVDPKIKHYDYIKPVSIAPNLVLAPNTALNVLQHPQGNVMQASLSASGVVQVDSGQGRVWYVNRTQGGSSGAPCFNDDWQLVALHHASVSRGFGSIREGILLSSIMNELSGFLS